MENNFTRPKQTTAAILFIIIAVLIAGKMLLPSAAQMEALALSINLLFSVIPYIIIVIGLLQSKGKFPIAGIGFILLALLSLRSLVVNISATVRFASGANLMALLGGPLSLVVLNALALASYVLMTLVFFLAAYGRTDPRKLTRQLGTPIFICRLLITIICGIQFTVYASMVAMVGGKVPAGSEMLVPNALLSLAIAVLEMIAMRKAARVAK